MELDPSTGGDVLPPLTDAINPIPVNGATGVSRTPTMRWDDVSGATAYRVYFGPTDPPPFVATVTTNSYTHPTPLAANTTYFWDAEPIR